LCGYDHATASEERRMFAWEDRLREQALSTSPPKIISRP